MPERYVSWFRRHLLGTGGAWRSEVRRGTPRNPQHTPPSRRVVSLTVSALLVLATGVVTLTLGPASASASVVPNPVAEMLDSGLPTVTVHASAAAMTNLNSHTGVTRTASCPTGTLVGGGGYVRNAANPATLPTNTTGLDLFYGCHGRR
jgi:hypothetical protein